MISIIHPPHVLDRGLLLKYLFHTENPYERIYVVADYSEDAKFQAISTHPSVRYYPIKEPMPDKLLAHRALRAIVDDIAYGHKIAVACLAGMNRSATFATIGYMIAWNGEHNAHGPLTFDEAIKVIREQRPRAAPYWMMANEVMQVAYDAGFVQSSDFKCLTDVCGSPDDFENFMHSSYHAEYLPQETRDRILEVLKKYDRRRQPIPKKSQLPTPND